MGNDEETVSNNGSGSANSTVSNTVSRIDSGTADYSGSGTMGVELCITAARTSSGQLTCFLYMYIHYN